MNATYQDGGATTKEFIKTIEEPSPIDLSSFFDDWFLPQITQKWWLNRPQ